jgi:quercetin dioxygenase-like cupin family protein
VSPFDDVGTMPPQQVWERIVARAVHGERLTLAVVELEPEAVVAEHSHDNEQLGVVLRGSIRFRVGDEERELETGGTWSIPPHVPHSAVAGADGTTVVDVFAPGRDDWRALPRQEPRRGRWP